MKEYILSILIGIALKILTDLAVRLSKRTENHVDDFLVNLFKSVVDGFNFKKK